MFCKVVGCRHPGSHVTSWHRCGKCGRHGHGQMECGKRYDMSRLTFESMNDRLPSDLWCQVRDCPYRWSHTNAAHATSCDDASTDVVERKCPHCNSLGPVNLEVSYFTNTECSVCMEALPCVLFERCRHVNVCAECAQRL